MNKAIAVAVSIGLLLLLPFAVMHAANSFQSADAPDEADSAGRIVIREARVGTEHYRNWVQNGILYWEDVNAQVTKPLRQFRSQAKPAKSVKTAEAASAYVRLGAQGPIDPASLGNGIRRSIPYTYDATLTQSSEYLSTLLNDGWTLAASFADADYIDCYIRKNGELVRLILLDDRLKLLYPIRGSIPDPQSFVIDQ